MPGGSINAHLTLCPIWLLPLTGPGRSSGSVGYHGVIEAMQNDIATRAIPVVLAIPMGIDGADTQTACVSHHLGMPPTYAEFSAAMIEAGLCESDFQD